MTGTKVKPKTKSTKPMTDTIDSSSHLV